MKIYTNIRDSKQMRLNELKAIDKKATMVEAVQAISTDESQQSGDTEAKEEKPKEKARSKKK